MRGNADLKAGCLVAGMAAGADSIDDRDVLRHGAMTDLFGGLRAPSTLGSFLQSFPGQRPAGGRRGPPAAGAAGRGRTPAARRRCAGVHRYGLHAKCVYGHAKQGAGFGHTKIQGKSLLVRGLNALAALISTPAAAPVIATRLRGGKASSAPRRRIAGRQAGCTGQIVFRIDSAYYSAAVLGAIRRGSAHFSVTARMAPDPRRDRCYPRVSVGPHRLPAGDLG